MAWARSRGWRRHLAAPPPQLPPADASAEAGTLAALPSPANYRGVRIKGQGLGEDRVARENEEIRCAIEVLRSMLDEQPHLELRYAESEDDYNEALKLYRDMNHLSLSGVTCEQVVEHVLSHTVVLFYKPSPDQPAIAVTAATFSMRQNTMMLRLLATHPRMTRKGFARITVHFLKEVCRALFKSDILVYTYPSSSPFYKAMHFKHTHPSGENQAAARRGGADAAEREKARDARRVFSAKENEMIFHVQPSMQQVLDEIAHRSANGVSSYACTCRRGTNAERRRASPPRVSGRGCTAARACRRRRRGASGRGGRGKRPAEPPPPPPPPPAHTVGRSTQGADSKAPTPSIPAMANGRAVVPSGSLLREANGHEKAARWLKAVTPAYVPGADDEDEDGVETTVSPRKRPKLGKEGRDEYAVEKIVDVHCFEPDGKDIKYLIKWKGWLSKYNTWEPLKHLTSLKAEIAAFESGR